MAKIYLDANIVIDVLGRNPGVISGLGKADIIFVSVLSLHIAVYVLKFGLPSQILAEFAEAVYLVPLDDKIAKAALLGPTDDYEDNIQLHSAVIAEADYFVTKDVGLRKMAYFGKTRLVGGVGE